MSNHFSASRWARYPIFFHPDELAAFFAFFHIKELFPLGKPLMMAESQLSAEEAVALYSRSLQKAVPFALAAPLEDPLSISKNVLSDGRILWMVQNPLLQIISFSFVVNRFGEILPKAMAASDAVFWGVELLYPQLYQKPGSHNICTLAKNHPLRQIPAWVREHSRPVCFARGKELLKPPFRIGALAFDLAASRPDLLHYGLVCMNRQSN